MGKTLTTKAIIFAGGEINDYTAIKPLLTDSFIIAADSGYRHCQRLGVVPNIIVGDLDSIKNPPANVELLTLPVEKNYTDSYFACKYALENNFSPLILAGFLGGRVDHALANLQLLVAVNRYTQAYIHDGSTLVYCIIAEDTTNCIDVPAKENYYFSVLSYSPYCERVTITNGKYPLNNYRLTNEKSRAISNEFVDLPVNITVCNGIALVTLVKKDY